MGRRPQGDRPPPMRRWLQGLLDLPPIALSIAAVVLLWQTVWPRLSYPYDLEWMEGGMLVHVWRLREGLPLYTPPSADWIPFLYPPLYPWLLSLLGPPDYALARALSLIFADLIGVAASVAVRRDGGSWGLSVAVAGIFWLGYDDVGAFYDLARNDTLALALAAWAMVVGRTGTRKAVVLAGLLLAGSFAAKHTYALLGVPMLLWLWRWRGRTRALEFAVASAGPALAWVLGLQVASDGHFLTYLLAVPGSHPLVGKRAWPLAEQELWGALRGLNAAALVACVVVLRERSWSWWAAVASLVALGLAWVVALAGPGWASGLVRSVVAPWLALAVVLVAASALLLTFWRRARGESATWWVGLLVVLVPLTILMRAHHGGFVNVLMPGIWILAVAGALAVQRMAHVHVALGVLGALLACEPLITGRWEVERFVPTDADVAALDTVVEAVREVEGEVLIVHAPWLPVLAGKAPSFPLIALWDVDHALSPYADEVRSIDAAFEARRWDAVFTASKILGHGMGEHYRRDRRLTLPGKAGYPKTGWRVRPHQVWVPKPTTGRAATPP